jgi:hypothetical protein
LDWIAQRILEAQAAAPVEAAVASRLERDLNGTICERALRNAELVELARQLIAAADPPEPTHED